MIKQSNKVNSNTVQKIFAFENAVGVPAVRCSLGGWVSDKCRVNQSRIRLLADPFIEFYFNGNGIKEQKTLLSSIEDKIHGTFIVLLMF